jgi:hypothetical protein
LLCVSGNQELNHIILDSMSLLSQLLVEDDTTTTSIITAVAIDDGSNDDDDGTCQIVSCREDGEIQL